MIGHVYFSMFGQQESESSNPHSNITSMPNQKLPFGRGINYFFGNLTTYMVSNTYIPGSSNGCPIDYPTLLPGFLTGHPLEVLSTSCLMPNPSHNHPPTRRQEFMVALTGTLDCQMTW